MKASLKNLKLSFSGDGATDYKEEGKTFGLVNAANCKLIGKSGIALAIQKLGGKELVKELEGAKGCVVSQNVVTAAYGELVTRGFSHVINAVGPDLREEKKGFTNKDDKYRLPKGTSAQEAFNLTFLHIVKSAVEKGITNIACPIISGEKFRGKASVDDVSDMTIKAIIYADSHIAAAGSKINFVLCTYEKSELGYLASLQKHYDSLVEQVPAKAATPPNPLRNLLTRKEAVNFSEHKKARAGTPDVSPLPTTKWKKSVATWVEKSDSDSRSSSGSEPDSLGEKVFDR